MRLPAALVGLGLLFAAEPQAKPRLSEPLVGLDGPRVQVSFELVDGFGAELLERIQTGLPSGFVYDIRLLRDRKRWFDRQVDASKLQVVAMYNAVTREYLVNYKQDGRLIESRVVRDEDELRRAMTRFESVPVFTLDGRGRRRLLVKARAELGTGTFLAFIPRRIATPWSESRKFRPPA